MDIDRDQVLEKGQYLCDEAVNYARQGAHSSAMEYFSQAETCFEKIQDYHWLTFLKHEKLQSLIALEKYDEALELSEEVSSGYLETKNYRGLTLLLIHKTNLFLDQGNIDSAMASLRLAEGVALKQNEKSSLGYVYSTLGGLYMDMKDYVLAIETLNSVSSYYSEEENPQETAWCWHLLGLCHEKIFHTQDAEKYYEKSSSLYLSINQYDSGATVMEDLRMLHQRAGNVDKEKILRNRLIQMGNLYPNTKY